MAVLNSKTTYLTTTIIVIVTLGFIWKMNRGKTQKAEPQKKDEKPQPKVRLFGLTQLYPDPQEPEEDDIEIVDIVAIHGLDSESPTAWTAWKVDGKPESGDVHWLKDSDMLPSKLPKSRIFTYDWPAGVGRDASLASMYNHSSHLLSSLTVAREETRTTTRPIIFVASCFGGLLLAKALLVASNPADDRYLNILQYTVGVAFLGTPFQGTDKFLHDLTLLRIAAAVEAGEGSSTELARYLRHDQDREDLDELVTNFCKLKKNPRYNLPIVCFCEQFPTKFESLVGRVHPSIGERLGTKGSTVLVKSHSACLPGENTESLPVRHNMLNKFNSPHNDGFKKLSFQLREFAKNAEKVLEQKMHYYEASRSSERIAVWLSIFDFSSDQRTFFSLRQKDTGKWFLESQEFTQWMEEEGSILFCPGISGAGKTTLASIVIEHLHEKFKKRRRVAIAYIYCDEKKQKDHTANSLLGCVLRQIVQGRYDVNESVQHLYDQFSKSMARPTVEDLSKALSSSIKDDFLELFIVIDALDECLRYERDQLLTEMFRLQKNCKARILATAQPISGIEKWFDKSKRLEISPPRQEILNYLEKEAQRILEPKFTGNSEIMNEITSTIATAADGMFLLARLYLNSLDSPKPEELRSTLRSLQALDPRVTRTEDGRKSALEEAYRKVVERIRQQQPNRARFAQEILSWIMVACRPLTITELQHALVLRPNEIGANKWQLVEPSTIASVCGGLVIVEESTNSIRLAHSTTRLFLEHNFYGAFAPENATTANSSLVAVHDFKIDANRGASTACIKHLRLPVFQTPIETLEEWYARLESYPFYKYAADYWEYHVDSGLSREDKHVREFRKDKRAMAAMCPVFSPIDQGHHYTRETGLPGVYDNLVSSMRKWVEDCDKCHEECTDISRYNSQRLIRLIDTKRMCIVTAPLPRDLEYVALSYLWGRYQATRLRTTNIHDLTMPNGLAKKPLPLTIREAISFCQRACYRYLWVDVLCIIQDDMKDWQYQALSTGEVFIHARFTIVAACGSHSNVGIFYTDLGDKIYDKPDAGLFRQVMSQTEWDERGWTFEEKILSRRLLIFTQNGPYFLCASRLYSPGGETAITPESVDRPLSLDKVECGRQLEMYLRIVQAFSTREFAAERDITFAMHAITSPLGSVMDGKQNTFLWGVPTCALDDLLCWRVERHDPNARRKRFPSWSWYGWKQMPQFPQALTDSLRNNGDRSDFPITRCVPGENLGLDWTDDQWGVMCLCLSTPWRILRVEMECIHERDDIYERYETNGLYRVREMRDNSMVGNIRLDKRWRQDRPSTMHFIPIFAASDDDGNTRIKMLMCLTPIGTSAGNEVFERVQIMDCDIHEMEWRAMENRGRSNDHVWLT